MSRQIQIHINEEYLDLVPRLNKEERSSLKQSIKEDGQLNPIIVNQDGMILDGHTRFEICQELHLKPDYKIKIFSSNYNEKKFVIISNLNRRHLNTYQKAELCYNIFEIETERAKLRVRNHKENTSEGRVYDIFGKHIGVGHTLAHMIIYLMRNADETTQNQLRNGTISIRRGYDKIKGINKNIPSRKKKYTPYTVCLNCSADLVTPEQRGCHTHTQYCCKVCRWGR